MIQGNTIKRFISLSLLGLVAACSSGSDGGINVQSVVQDLTADPDGLTTRITFSEDPGALGLGNFSASAGQAPLSLVGVGNVVRVTWDDRVTRNHTVRILGTAGVEASPRSVAPSDASVPSFAITSAVQDTSDSMLGGDTLSIAFSGPRVIASEVVDPNAWTLTVDSTAVDLAGTLFSFDQSTQVLDVTLGADANLHQNFTLSATSIASVADVPLSSNAVAGVATGDAVPLTAPTVEQRLAVDALGRVVDFIFPKPMDPNGGIQTARFAVNDHPGSTTLTVASSILQVDDFTLRVTFSAPVVPGLDTISLNAIPGYHGNTFSGTEAIVNSAPAVNAYSSVTATTVENLGGDNIVVITDQALDPDLAVDPAGWSLTVDGNVVNLADQTLTYDLASRALTIELDLDMVNGDVVVVTAIGRTDIDGESFGGAPVFPVAASGDVNQPALVSALQNRTADVSGQTVDVTFSEDLDPTVAANVAFYAFVPSVTINSAQRVGGAGRIVRLQSADPIVPGDFTFSVTGNVADLSGTTIDLGATSPVSITTTDTQDPLILGVSSNVPEGADNDTVVVLFSDQMIESEVETPANWSVESPIGTAIDVSSVTIDYSGSSATMTLDSGNIALKVGGDVQVTLNGMRDVGGRSISPTPGSGSITGELVRPFVDTVWRDATDNGQLVVYFSEPSDELDDLFEQILNPAGTRFALRDDDVAQTLRGYPTNAQILDGGLGVRLTYGFVIDLDDTVDVIGATDLAGNIMFPGVDLDILDEDPAIPSQGSPNTLLAIEGEGNDTFTLRFNEDMSPWRLLDPAQYTVEETLSGTPLDLSTASFEVVGSEPTVLIMTLGDSSNIQNGIDYDVTLNVDPANPLRTAQGVALTVPEQAVLMSGGDIREPLEVASSAITDPADNTAMFVLFNEAMETSSVSTGSNYVFDGGTATGTTVNQLSPRVVRVVFDGPISAGSNVVIAAGATDLAGIPTPMVMTLAVTDDVSIPLLDTVTPTAVEGNGSDTIEVSFNEPVELATALDRNNYTVTNGATNVDLTGATLSWFSADNAVTIHLDSNTDLDASSPVAVQVQGVADYVGNTMTPVSLMGAVVGDINLPALESAFVNLRTDPLGNTVDILFSEDVDSAHASDPSNWTASGGQLVLAVQTIDSRHYRMSFVGPLGATDTLDITPISDAAGNLSGTLSIDPEN